MTLNRLYLLALSFTLGSMIYIGTAAWPDGKIFQHLLAVHDLPAAWLLVGILAFGYGLGMIRTGEVGWVERLILGLDRQRFLVALVLWLALCAGSLLVYRNHPLSMDEYAALFQAKVFAAGSLNGQVPPDLLDLLIPRAFQNHFLMVNRDTGAVVSAYWPGFSLLLTPFVWLGIPWACNPTLVSASYLLIGRITRELGDSPLAAGWAMLFALASPAFLANGITYYSMPAHLFFNLLFAWLLLGPTPLRLILAGAIGSFALALHNPFPHIVFALPWVLWLATRRGRGLRNLAWLLGGYAPLTLLLVVGWPLLLQHILHDGVQAAASATNVAPSLLQRGLGLLGSFARFFNVPDQEILSARTAGLVKLWLWASPLLLLLAWWGWRGEKNPGVRLLGASALLTFFAYFLIRFDQGHGWGYRYFHSAWGVLPILAALGTIKLARAEGSRVLRQVALLALLSLVAANTLRFVQMGEFMAAHLAQFPPRVEAARRIVLHNGLGYYAYDLIQNDPWLRGGEVVFLLRGKADLGKILEHYPSAREASRNRYGVTLTDAGNGS